MGYEMSMVVFIALSALIHLYSLHFNIATLHSETEFLIHIFLQGFVRWISAFLAGSKHFQILISQLLSYVFTVSTTAVRAHNIQVAEIKLVVCNKQNLP